MTVAYSLHFVVSVFFIAAFDVSFSFEIIADGYLLNGAGEEIDSIGA